MGKLDQLDVLMQKMWNDYIDLSPQAQKIVNLLKEQNEEVVNDHIALRTFDHARVNVDVIAKPFLSAGYVEKQDYFFKEKKLYAKHYEHSDKTRAKIFIIQLEVQ